MNGESILSACGDPSCKVSEYWSFKEGINFLIMKDLLEWRERFFCQLLVNISKAKGISLTNEMWFHVLFKVKKCLGFLFYPISLWFFCLMLMQTKLMMSCNAIKPSHSSFIQLFLWFNPCGLSTWFIFHNLRLTWLNHS